MTSITSPALQIAINLAAEKARIDAHEQRLMLRKTIIDTLQQWPEWQEELRLFGFEAVCGKLLIEAKEYGADSVIGKILANVFNGAK